MMLVVKLKVWIIYKLDYKPEVKLGPGIAAVLENMSKVELM